jgi:hypothetical protein
MIGCNKGEPFRIADDLGSIVIRTDEHDVNGSFIRATGEAEKSSMWRIEVNDGDYNDGGPVRTRASMG